MRILAVDDEPSILELLKAYLEAANSDEVVTALSGADALAIIDQADVDFDCLLLDIQMPQMNGVTLCEMVRALPDYAHVPIIMLTAMSQKTYVDKAFSVGATDYITKPFDLMELRGRLNAASKIMYEHHRASDNAETAQRWVLDRGSDIKTALEEPLTIDGIERVVGYSAFENYLMTLSRTKLLFASAFAVKILDFKALHANLSMRELRGMLKSTARVIAEYQGEAGNLMSYRGNGIFLCIDQKRSSLSPRVRETQINRSLTVNRVTAQSKTEIQVVVGQEYSLVSVLRSGALIALRRAVESVEDLGMPMEEVATLSKRILRSQSKSREQTMLDRRAYEVLLQDIARDESRQTG